jgi:hypothetical protein
MVCLRPRRITETKRSEPRLAIVKPGRFTRSFCGSLTRANLALHYRVVWPRGWLCHGSFGPIRI